MVFRRKKNCQKFKNSFYWNLKSFRIKVEKLPNIGQDFRFNFRHESVNRKLWKISQNLGKDTKNNKIMFAKIFSLFF